MLKSPLLCLSEVFAKSFKQIEFCNVFGLSNVIYAVIDSRNWKCVRFGDRIYFTIVCTHAKCPIRFWNKNTRRTPFTLTRSHYPANIELLLGEFVVLQGSFCMDVVSQVLNHQ